jgi:hypothetical protein
LCSFTFALTTRATGLSNQVCSADIVVDYPGCGTPPPGDGTTPIPCPGNLSFVGAAAGTISGLSPLANDHGTWVEFIAQGANTGPGPGSFAMLYFDSNNNVAPSSSNVTVSSAIFDNCSIPPYGFSPNWTDGWSCWYCNPSTCANNCCSHMCPNGGCVDAGGCEPGTSNSACGTASPVAACQVCTGGTQCTFDMNQYIYMCE